MTNFDDNAEVLLDAVRTSTTATIGGDAFLFTGGGDPSGEGISVFRIDATGLAIDGTGGSDTINALSAPAGELLPGELGDTINGFGGNDTLDGLGGNDILNGGAGNDTLRGGSGDDVLTGGAGRDFLYGDAGQDFFDFNSKSESKKGGSRDKINHFQRGQDDIDLRTIDAKSGSNTAPDWHPAEGCPIPGRNASHREGPLDTAPSSCAASLKPPYSEPK